VALTSVQVEGAIRPDQPLRLSERQRDFAQQHEALVSAEDAQHSSALAANHRGLLVRSDLIDPDRATGARVRGTAVDHEDQGLDATEIQAATWRCVE
jgi:hypothetical protein